MDLMGLIELEYREVNSLNKRLKSLEILHDEAVIDHLTYHSHRNILFKELEKHEYCLEQLRRLD